MNLRTVGGKDQTVVLDEAVVGVHAEDGWTGGSVASIKLGRNKADDPSARTSPSWLITVS